MEFQITMRIDNAAFQTATLPEWENEVARILQELMERIEPKSSYSTITDINGNVVGNWGVYFNKEDILA